MRIVCAWCGRIISEPSALVIEIVKGVERVQTSHGICPRCLEENITALERIKPDHGGSD